MSPSPNFPRSPNLAIVDACTDLACRSAKLYEIGAGTSEVRRMVIGRVFNKEYASYSM